MPQPMHLPNTQLLTERGDLAELMVAGIQRYLLRATEASVEKRQRHWHRDTKTPAAYAQSVEDNRQRLAKIIGAQDPRSTPELSYLADRPVAHGRNYEIHAVRWRTFERLDAEGLLLEPKRKARAQIIAIPDADQTPESLAGLEKGHNNAFAARLAQSGSACSSRL